ncbi:MAG: sulfatase [Holophagae bacterium]|nr:sulfatase [Holophagae bacterium]
MKNKNASRLLQIALPLALLGSAAASPEKPLPNMVFILADDLGWMDTSVYQRRHEPAGGAAYYETPNIDRLAEQGMLFTQAYVSPMCSPTRAMLLTGRHNAETGILKATYECAHDENHDEVVAPRYKEEYAVLPAPNRMFLEGRYETFAEVLSQNGYACGFLGKWHVGYHNKIPSASPAVQGFDPIAYYDTGGSSYRNWFPTWEKFGQPMAEPKECYLTVAESQSACRFIRQNKNNRFLLYYCSGGVHSPFEDDPASGYKESFERKGRNGWLDERVEPWPVYAAMVKSLDDAVGKVLDQLENTRGPDGHPLSENTLVVFLSDNGGINRHQFSPEGSALHNKIITSNYPLRGAKGNVYEGGVRVPLLVRWPGRVEPRSVCDVPVTGQDICSLLLEAGGLEKQKNAGSLLALLKDPQDAAGYGRDTFFYHFPFWWPHAEAGSPLPDDPPMSAVRRGRYKLIYYYTGKLELYDLETDLGERTDLATQMPEKTEELRVLLQEWLKSDVAPRYIPARNPNFNQSTTPYGDFRDVMGFWNGADQEGVTVFFDNGSIAPGSTNAKQPFGTGDRDMVWDVAATAQNGLADIGATVMSVRMVPFNIFANSRGTDAGGGNGLAIQTGTQSFWMDGKTAEAALFQVSFYSDAAKTKEINGVEITFKSILARIGVGGSQMMLDAYAGSGALAIGKASRPDDQSVSLGGRPLTAENDTVISFASDRGMKAAVATHTYYTIKGSGSVAFSENDSFWVRRRIPIGTADVAYQLGGITFELTLK